MIRAAEDVARITEALRERNDAVLLVNMPNADPNPPYRLEKAWLGIHSAEQTLRDLEESPQRFQLDRITAALTITLLKKATDELRTATEDWERYLTSIKDQ